jgi:hypothetical protein
VVVEVVVVIVFGVAWGQWRKRIGEKRGFRAFPEFHIRSLEIIP